MLIAMTMFSISMSFSPGPVNVLALSSGLRVGFKKSLAFVLGATLGFTLLLYFIGAGLALVMLESPIFMTALSVGGSSFIAYSGWQLLKSKTTSNKDEHSSKLKFIDGFILQWLNPKAWVACLASVSAFSLTAHSLLLQFTLIYFFVCFFGISSWVYIGTRAAKLIHSHRFHYWCNKLLGGLLIIIAAYLLAI